MVMSANRERLERMQILVSPSQKKRMRMLAKKSNCSVSELYRRAADAYTVDDDDEEIHNAELEAMVEVLEAGISRANAATVRAEREVQATLDFYQARAQAREARA